MTGIPIEAPDGDDDRKLQAEIDAYCKKEQIGIPQLRGLFLESVKEFRKYGIGLAEIDRLSQNGLHLTHVEHFVEGGVNDVEAMIELNDADVSSLAVLPYKEAGITDLEELKALGKLGLGGMLTANDIKRCGFSTHSEIVAALEAGRENGAATGKWSAIRKEAKLYGAIGKRIVKVHPVPKTTTSILTSKQLRRELAKLDDEQLKVVIRVIELGETISVKEAQALIKSFR